MDYKKLRNCLYLISAIIFIVLIAYILLHTYNLWKFEGPKFSEENYSLIELLFARQKGAIILTFFGTAMPLLLGVFCHSKHKLNAIL